jgi:hypothetical protein
MVKLALEFAGLFTVAVVSAVVIARFNARRRHALNREYVHVRAVTTEGAVIKRDAASTSDLRVFIQSMTERFDGKLAWVEVSKRFR